MSARRASPELQLALELVRLSPRVDRIERLAEEVSYEHLIRVLDEQRLLALLGNRLVRLKGRQVPLRFAQAVAQTTRRGQQWGAVLHMQTAHILQALEDAGVSAMPLKGPFSAAWLHGDPGLRLSGDIDILVARESLPAAIATLTQLGFLRPTKPSELPRLHHQLALRDGGPVLELHWRAHWYEGRFSAVAVNRSERIDGVRRPLPADEFIMLLGMYARDGLMGLRWLTDIEAWWRQCQASISPAEIGRVLGDHPELGPAVAAAALAAKRIVGLETPSMVPRALLVERRVRMAARIADWTTPAGDPAGHARSTAVNMLLCPPEQLLAQALRDYMPPLAGPRITEPPRQLAHATVALVRSANVLWNLRRGRALTPHPALPTVRNASARSETRQPKSAARA